MSVKALNSLTFCFRSGSELVLNKTEKLFLTLLLLVLNRKPKSSCFWRSEQYVDCTPNLCGLIHSMFYIVYSLFTYQVTWLTHRFSFVLVSIIYDQCLCKSVMRMLLFQLCSLLLIHKANSAGCLRKYGFGLELFSKELVDRQGQSSFPFDLDDCETKCLNVVRWLYIQE